MAGWKYFKFRIVVQKVNTFKEEKSIQRSAFQKKETSVEISMQFSSNFDRACILIPCSNKQLCYLLVLLPSMG